MKYVDIFKTLRGISTPFFGVSWEPPIADRDIARKVVTFLEDRRVLYAPCEMEVPHHCCESVMAIRRELTNRLAEIGDKSVLDDSLRAMRAACRRFLNIVDSRERYSILAHGGQLGHWANWVFSGELGVLRGVFGIHIARIAAAYGIDIERELAAILPADVE